ncbi:TIGR03564 family F420-dependent LLM class oxidoreductase [Gordonia soli]|uniref:Putative F420-dependent oxidoreductase n=1 Tax=Gordonia soli NBRC 108243 TaxID=1223545 RepID=M0QII9_9ACTN|nr:TIGR03564 family F420-dependent LLM class oxidoreductase [Gordonia soli]GAC68420.1 putative F420-dependent oxidoreductase [Gordonia soli NBRC 108243]
MEISLSVPGVSTFDAMVDAARSASEAGLSGVWLNQVDGWDALTAVAALSAHAPDLGWGTSIVPTFTRHPLVLASQALTIQAATGNRFSLGVGPSHPAIIEGGYGVSYRRPATHTSEYLSVLRPLLRGERVTHTGEWFGLDGAVQAPGVVEPEVLLSALGPRMLRIAGELADGTIVVWVRPDHIAQVIRPALLAAADAAGRGATPKVIAGVIATVTDRSSEVRAEIDAALGFAGDLPAYRSLLDRQGLSAVTDTVLIGSADEVEAGIADFRDAGVDELIVSVWGSEPAETVDVLRGVVAREQSIAR